MLSAAFGRSSGSDRGCKVIKISKTCFIVLDVYKPSRNDRFRLTFVIESTTRTRQLQWPTWQPPMQRSACVSTACL